MRFVLLSSVLLTCACATTATRAWVDDAKLTYDAAKYPDDAAVILYRADKTTLELKGNDSLTRRERHEVTAIRGENGFWLAEVTVPTRAKDTLAGFRARLIQPDGSRREFEAKDFLSDVSAKGERSYNAHYFRFPDVKVGSVLEYWWVVESEFFWNADEQETLGEYPVKHYEFELTAAKPLVVETIEWNEAAPIQAQEWAGGEHHLRFALDDLPRREAVDFAPDYTFVEPRWAWRVLAWRSGRMSYDWLRDWKDVVESQSEKFYFDRTVLSGFTRTLDTKNCSDVPCLVARAQAAVIGPTNDSDLAYDRALNLEAALTSGRASIAERALMMRLLLERAGVEAWLAFGTDALSRQQSPSFPRLAQFNHLFVYLPRQKGLDAPMTIDPDCTFCAPGQLTARHREQPIYVFRTEQQLGKKTEGRWEKAFGAAAPASERRFTHHARVDADGTVVDDVTTTTVGIESIEPARVHQQHADRLKRREADVWSNASGLKKIQSNTWGECERLKGSCSWSSKVEFPAQAWKSGAAWTVQLGFLAASYRTLFDAETRSVDVHFKGDDLTLVEVLELEAPPGTKLSRVPVPVNVNAGSLQANVSVERTPTGARVTRRLQRTIGFEPKAKYEELRAAADAYKRVRHLVLTFEP